MSKRPPAPHVQAAIARTAQAKPAPQRPVPVPAPRLPQAPAAPKPPAPHVHAALVRGVQARMEPPRTSARPAAPPIQPKLSAGVVQRADEDNPYKKRYTSNVPGVSQRLSRKAKTEHKLVHPKKPSRRQVANLGGVLNRDFDPGYKPGKDSAGNKIWDGQRSGLGWYDNVQNAMNAIRVNCGIGRGGCTGNADSIDHVTDFADLQSGLTRYVVCDGLHHFSACYKVDALDLFNGGNTDTTANNDLDLTNFNWSCTQCNSGKNGKKGLYQNQPRWIKKCPGACGYSFRGEQSGD
jgi:hypothetical protein